MKVSREQAMPPGQASPGETAKRFSDVYDSKIWGQGSGVGSMPKNNLEYSAFLQKFISDNGIRSVVDFGCGDWQFSRYIDWSGVQYIGIDVVDSVIQENTESYRAPNISFKLFDSFDTIPNADLLLCKDVLQHLPNRMVAHYLEAFKTKCRLLLITNDDYPENLRNVDITVGGWRTLRLELEPFAESAAVIFSWVVLWGTATTRKCTYLLYGHGGSR